MSPDRRGRPRARRPRATRSAASRLAAAAGGALVVALAAGPTWAAAPPADQPDLDEPDEPDEPISADGPPGRSPLGPLWTSDQGRHQMRGDRHELATALSAYVPRPAEPDREWFAALAGFERSAMPEDAPPERDLARLTRAPAGWLAELAVPDLGVRWTSRLVSYLTYFKADPKGRSMMAAWFRRKARYERRIRQIFREVGVPEDLLFVALAESGFHPGVKSSVGAAGLWQFMAPTGKVYGLESSYWIDDRHDFERSTWAAAAFLKDLRVRFGSWELALAAYNAGYGNVMTALRRNNTNNYWALCELENGLPWATVNYTPKIFAAAIVGRNPAAFGLDPAAFAPEPPPVEVTVPPKTAIAELAAKLEVSPDLLGELNARYVRGRTPPDGKAWPVWIPRAALERFHQRAPELGAGPARWAVVTARWGESIAELAHAHGVTEKALRRDNAIEDSAELVGGTALLVPVRPPGPPAPPERALAAVPVAVAQAPGRVVFFRVTRASTPAVIAELFSTPWAELARLNELDPLARLQDGLMLGIPVASDWRPGPHLRVYERGELDVVVRGSAAHLDAELARRGLVRRGHRVKKGERLDAIAARYGLSAGSLARINGVSGAHQPEPGEIVIVYVEPKATAGTVEPPPPRGGELERATRLSPPGPAEPDHTGAPRPSTPETSRVPARPRGRGRR